MKFKELVDKYEFADIVNEMRARWDKGNLYLFREALDILKLLQPKEAGWPIEIKHCKTEYEEYDRVCNMDGHSWDVTLDCELEVGKDVHLTEKELLALCLWERTFYGFSPEQEMETVDSWSESLKEGTPPPDNLWFRERLALKRRRYRSEVKPKDRHYDGWGNPLWPAKVVIGRKYSRMNCRRRKAEERYLKRCKYLSQMSEKAETIRHIIYMYHALNQEDLHFIMTSESYSCQCFKSRVANLSDGVDYLIESMTRYSDLPKSTNGSRVVVLFCQPLDYSLTATDRDRLNQAIQQTTGQCPDIFEMRNTEDTNVLRLTIIQSNKPLVHENRKEQIRRMTDDHR